MKIGMIGIMNNPATSLNSHSAGYNRIMAQQIGCDILTEKDDWSQYDRLIINHGPNFRPGKFNVIGGMNEEIYKRIDKLASHEGEILTLDGFQMREFTVAKKIENGEWDEFPPCAIIGSGNHSVRGDSHVLSVWQPNHALHMEYGKTLWGFLKNPKPADVLYFGNIDIRFHLMRQPDPEVATTLLAARYLNFAKANDCAIAGLLPVESEKRKLPQTGYYKGKPFYGSQQDRNWLVFLFNDFLRDSGYDKLIMWPKNWYTNLEFYENEIMEPRQSVHIRPKYYMHKFQ